MNREFTFLPFLRSGLTARAAEPAADGLRRRVTLGVQPKANGATQGVSAIEKSVDIYSAGDIQGINTSMFAAVEPRKGSKGVEPNYFPYIDFVDADFPWRYSLDVSAGDGKGRIKPWLSLIVLEADEFSYLTKGATPLPALEVINPKSSLPNLNTSWVTAHTQVSTAGTGSTSLSEIIENDPSSQFARLICTRRLSANTSYYAFLVPVFEAGRLSGLGQDVTPENWDDLAWDHQAEVAVQLPYYYTWSFTTDEMADFESLVRRLSPNADDGNAEGATRSVSIEEPGFFSDTHWPQENIEAEAAIMPPSFVRAPEIIERSSLTAQLADTLTETLQSDATPSSENDHADAEDPLVTLPIYGRYYTEPESITHEPETAPWVDEINLDLRLRLGAGAGAEVVKAGQEAFMSQCWAQSGAIQEANQSLANLQVAEKVSAVMVDKHIQSVPAETILAMSVPFLDLVDAGDGISMSAKLNRQALPVGAATRSLRRTAAKRPTISYSKSRGEGVKRKATIASASTYLTGKTRDRRIATAMAKKRQRAIDSARKVATARMSTLTISDEHAELLKRNSAVEVAPTIRVGKIDLQNYKVNLIARVENLALDKAMSTIDPGRNEAITTLDPITKAPLITEGLADRLVKYDRKFILANAADLPEDSVTLGVENRPFIEAVLAGANHEMIKELVWREFPVEITETVFKRFWDRGEVGPEAQSNDVTDLDQWTGHAGDHFIAGDEARLILIVRGELIKRYPDVQIGVLHMSADELSGFSLDDGRLIEPQFQGLLGGKTGYYGFDLSVEDLQRDPQNYFFAIFQPLGRFRFGLDIATRAKRSAVRRAVFQETPASLDDLSWSHMHMTDSEYIDFSKTVSIADGSDHWGRDRNSASIAQACLQKPVCTLIRATRLLNNG